MDIMLVILKDKRNGLSLMILWLWDSAKTIFRQNALGVSLISMFLMITNGIRPIRPPSLLMFCFMRKLGILGFKLM